MHPSRNDPKLAQKGAIISICAYLLLSVVKVSAGFWFHSKALTADGLNNTTDILVSVAILIGLQFSGKPRDHNHPYGHLRSEGIASLMASFIMAAVGIQVILNALNTIFSQESTAPELFTVWIAVPGILLMYGVYRYNLRLAKKLDRPSLRAAAKDNLTDAWVTVGAVVGILGAQWGFPWLDPLAAVVVGILICKTAWDIFQETAYQLTDGFNPKKLDEYRSTIKSVNGVVFIKDIKARVLGNETIVDVVIQVHPDMDIVQTHRLTDQIEKRMYDQHHVTHSHIHVEPFTHVQLKKRSY